MKWLILNYYSLIIINILMVYSSTYKSLLANEKSPFSELIVIILFQIVFTILSIIVLNNYEIFKKIIDKNVKLIFYIIIGILILVLVQGSSAGGAVSILKVGPINFQPMELAKVFLIFYMAKVLSKKKRLKTFGDWVKVLALPLLAAFLVLMEYDLGGTLIMLALIVVMVFLNGKELLTVIKALVVLIITAIAGIFILLKSTPESYQIERIGAWLNPFNYLAGAGGNLVQSYIAISNGGLFGSGYLNSTQNTGYLFASSSDFIFSVIIEEFGIVGAFVVIILLTLLAMQIYYVGYNSSNKYNYLVASGFAALILIQTMVNIGGVTGVIPMTGVTLPFISKGINSLVFLSLGYMYILIIKRENLKERNERKKQKRAVRSRSVL